MRAEAERWSLRDVVGDRVQAGVGDADADRRLRRRPGSAHRRCPGRARCPGGAGSSRGRLQVVDLAGDLGRDERGSSRPRPRTTVPTWLAGAQSPPPCEVGLRARGRRGRVADDAGRAGRCVIFLTSSADVSTSNATQKSRCAPARRVASARRRRPARAVLPLEPGERLGDHAGDRHVRPRRRSPRDREQTRSTRPRRRRSIDPSTFSPTLPFRVLPLIPTTAREWTRAARHTLRHTPEKGKLEPSGAEPGRRGPRRDGDGAPGASRFAERATSSSRR